ncbi:DUF3047 domain-containing protein [soil metagenome]
MNRLFSWLLTLLVLAHLTACSTTSNQPREDVALRLTPWATASSHTAELPAWQHFKLPGKEASRFTYTRTDGRDAMAVLAVSSASMLRQVVRIEPEQLDSVRFSWKVPELIAGADMALRETDDSPVRIVLAFEGDRSKFSPKNAMLSELSRAITGEEMPYATLMYVWCNDREPGSVIINPRTDRIRKLVVQTGPKQLNQWLDYKRNIRADYERVFGESPGALVAIGIMTDSDNTHSTARAWYGPVRLTTTAGLSR